MCILASLTLSLCIVITFHHQNKCKNNHSILAISSARYYAMTRALPANLSLNFPWISLGLVMVLNFMYMLYVSCGTTKNIVYTSKEFFSVKSIKQTGPHLYCIIIYHSSLFRCIYIFVPGLNCGIFVAMISQKLVQTYCGFWELCEWV